jgi:CheY-like chemotaxis protein
MSKTPRCLVEQLQQEQVGLVISDVVMPVMDGYALSRAIRDTTPPAETPILLITGEDTPREAADRARSAGAQAVLQKPFNAHTLCRAVEAVLDADGHMQ